MEQNTDEWLNWRRQGIGASDVPIIMNVSPYKTPLQLWEEKMGLRESQGAPNFIQQKGHELEVIARNKFEIETGKTWEPALVEHAKFPHFRASLDGINAEKNTVWECKFVGQEIFDQVQNDGMIPEHYWPQVQWQLFVTGAEMAVFYVIKETHEVAKTVVTPDIEYIKKMVRTVSKFWKMIQDGEVPKPSDRDTLEIIRPDLKEKVSLLSDKKKQLVQLSGQIKELEKDIISSLPHTNCNIHGVVVKRIKRQGSVDYSKIPEIQEVDLDQYRKKDSYFYKWNFPKEEK